MQQDFELAQEIVKYRFEVDKLNKLIDQFKGLLDALPDPVFMKDEKLLWIYGNPVILKLYGIDPDNYLGKAENELLPAEFAESCMQSDEHAKISREIGVSEERARDDEGKMHYYEVFKVPFYEEDTFKGLIGIGRDITLRKEALTQLEQNYRQLESVFNTDYLTGLLNFQAFLAQTQVALTTNIHKEYALLIIKINNFGKINDKKGFKGGDIILTQFGYMLLTQINSNEYATRLGSQRFALLLEYTNENRLRERVKDLFMEADTIAENEDIDGLLSVSIGVSTSKKSLNINELVYRTDFLIRNSMPDNSKHSCFMDSARP